MINFFPKEHFLQGLWLRDHHASGGEFTLMFIDLTSGLLVFTAVARAAAEAVTDEKSVAHERSADDGDSAICYVHLFG